ncbi:MAG: hypothetical protein LQ343_007891 [Gyalolechia ehrenbergii]|nr:MAG: hypothetical protein LQ343_007891 [Gyalolechia ehrenbergii]
MITILVLAAAIGFSIYRYTIYPAFFSPLSKIATAHFTASWSPLWILWIRYRGVEVQTIHKAHVKFGPIVRLGPNEISVNCVDGGLRTVYAGGFEKWAFYDQFENYGVPCMFSMKESKPHSVRKRMMSNVYSKTYLQSSKDADDITRTILFDRLLPVLEKSAAEGSTVEVHELNYATAMDFISSYIFGLANGSNFHQNVEMRKRFLSWHFKRTEHSFWNQEIPSLTRLIQSIGIRLVPKWVDVAYDEIQAWLLRLCRLAKNSAYDPEGDSTEEHASRSVVYSQLSSALKKSAAKAESEWDEKSQTTEEEEIHIASELLDHVIAGMDTSAITLTYLLWEVSRNAKIQRALHDEMRDMQPNLAIGDSAPMPSARYIDSLPILHSVLMETLRRHTAIPGSQPRVTPATPTSLAGSPPLPGGVRVSAQAYSLHRNEEVFPDPEFWNPGRWTKTGQESKDEMMQLKYVTAAIYANFSTSIVDDTGIEQIDRYVAGPEEEQLQLKFTRLQPSDLR